MTLFWLAGAALAAAALALVLRPLLSRRAREGVSRREANLSIYRDQLRELDADLAAGKLAPADYERARRELEGRLLEDVPAAAEPGARRAGRGVALAAGAAIPVLAAALYLAVGNPGSIARPAGEHQVSAEQIEAMVGRLAARLRENPGEVEGWKLLGRSYMALGRFPEAAQAYASAAEQAPRDAALLADFADALAMARGQRLAGEPEKLVLRSLEIDPANLKALALAGTAAFERRDYGVAADFWQRMLAHVPPDSEDAQAIRANVAEARSLAGAPPAKSLKGTVTLSAKLKDRIAPEDTVFVFARAAEGPQLPLAVQRLKARELPAAFALDDSMAMAPGMTLSAHPRVVVTARVSKSGAATPQPGDLQGASAPVPHDAGAVAIVIDTVVR